ncbi:MAG: RNA polymerase sigma factor [Acidimicrobiales bacterium]
MDESHVSRGADADASLDGLTALYASQVVDVYGFVFRRCGGDVGLAEDITQETFVAAARHFRLNADVPSPAWLYQVARSRLIDHWRAEARKERKVRLVAGGRATQPASDPADVIVSGRRVVAALSELPATQHAALVLRYLDGYTTKDVATTLNRSVKATESLLARARRNLEAVYQEQDGE